MVGLPTYHMGIYNQFCFAAKCILYILYFAFHCHIHAINVMWIYNCADEQNKWVLSGKLITLYNM